MSADLEKLRDRIADLKRKRNAIILAHNYQREEVQEIADFTGDSLELSQQAAKADCEVIVFCGVHFMAESASILSPDKTVLLPALDAGCPMADMIQVSSTRKVWKTFPGYDQQPSFVFPHDFTLRDIRGLHPNAPVVAYVNTTAAVKAESDICCTSSNVVRVVESLPEEEIICIPDRNLSLWAARNTNKRIIAWDGFCHVHDRVTAADVERVRTDHPGALLMAHPECRPEVLDLADHVTSTSGMLRFAAASEAEEFIVGTETGLIHRLVRENPSKRFTPLRRDMVCPNMKKTRLETVEAALAEMKHVIKVPEETRLPAKRALDRMLAIR